MGALAAAGLPLLAALVLAPSSAWALSADAGSAANPDEDEDDTEIENKYLASVEQDAATYRLHRTHFVASPGYDAAGAAYLEQARAILATGQPQPLETLWRYIVTPAWWFLTPSPARRAGWLAEDGFSAYPYCASAGDLLATEIEAYARRGDLEDLHTVLFQLWFYLPDYPHLPHVMATALDACDRTQNFAALVHLEKSDPHEVITIRGEALQSQVTKLYRFLVLHGDRESMAPRAALGLARGLLCAGGAENLFAARREYEQFCETYPASELIFPALCERALSYLVAYRGSDYDVGALDGATSIIDQAEIEARGLPDRVRTVQDYRRRIRLWHQDRDLEVARWYRRRAAVALAWLVAPGTAASLWTESARYFYREVIRQDSTSDEGRTAQREMAELPPPPSDLFVPVSGPPARQP